MMAKILRRSTQTQRRGKNRNKNRQQACLGEKEFFTVRGRKQELNTDSKKERKKLIC